MQTQGSCRGGAISMGVSQSAPNDTCSGSIYGCAIGQAVGSSLLFRVSDTQRQIFESEFGALSEYGCSLNHIGQLTNVARPCVCDQPCFRLRCDPGKVLLRFRGKSPQKIFSKDRYIFSALS